MSPDLANMLWMSFQVLKEHADDCHHGQSAVGQLCRELLGLLLRIRRSQHLEAIVTRSAGLVVIEATAELDEAKVRSDLSPSCHWNLGNCCKAVGDVSELEAGRRRQESRPHLIQKYKHLEGKESMIVLHSDINSSVQLWFVCKTLSSEQLANHLWSDVSSVRVPAQTNTTHC